MNGAAVTYQVHVSGRTFYRAFDPDCSGILAEIGVTHEIHKSGYGVTVSLFGSRSQLRELLDALEDIRDIDAGGGVDSESGERAAVRKDCERLRKELTAIDAAATGPGGDPLGGLS